jgi:polar amino acid transport system permease protein
LRGGIASISKGQFLACKTLGIPKAKAWIDIFIPQVLRVSIPSLVSEFTTLVKETAILSFVGEQDIMKHASDLGASTYSYLGPLLVAGGFYYLICNSIMFISKYLEQRMNKHV